MALLVTVNNKAVTITKYDNIELAFEAGKEWELENDDLRWNIVDPNVNVHINMDGKS